MSSKPFDGEALNLSALFLDMVIDPRRCSDVLRELCQAFGASAGQFALLQRPGDRIVASHAHGLRQSVLRAYTRLKDVLHADPRLRAALKRPGQPDLCRNIVSEATLHRSELYKTFLKPAGIGHSLVLVLPVDQTDFLLALTLMRASDATPFEEADVVNLRTITPHLKRVSELTARRLEADGQQELHRILCERAVIAILVVDRNGGIVFENPAASELLNRQGGGLRRTEGRLTHSNSHNARALAAAITNRATATPRSGSHHLLLPQAGRGSALHATFSLLPEFRGRGAGKRDKSQHVVITLVDPIRTYEPDERMLQASFGLTAAEASILKLLAEGQPIGRIAEIRGSMLGTVRNQINTIMSKTGVHRQTDLIRLSLSAASLFRDD